MGFGVLYGLPIALVIAVGGIWVGREVYKADPYALSIWQRHLKYKRYYAPRGHRKVDLPAIKDSFECESSQGNEQPGNGLSPLAGIKAWIGMDFCDESRFAA